MLNQVSQFGNHIDPSLYGLDQQIVVPKGPPARFTSNFADMSTTVYVGHICSRISDESVKELLDICGQVTKWLRQPDPMTGKLAHFGFCEFKRLEGAWRAVHLLNGRQIGSKCLVVKADAKIQERIDDFPNTQRISFETEQRVGSTVNALVTTINSKWREEAMANDAELQSVVPTEPALPTPPVPTAITEDVLPKWYKNSRREEDRLRRIERRKRERQTDFEKAVKNWETYEEKRIARELEKETEEADELIEKKTKIISQDGGGGKVTSDFTWVERKREVEADNRDRLNEEKERAAKPERDLAELSELEARMKSFPFSEEPMSEICSSSEIELPQGIPQQVKDAVRSLPKTKEGLEKSECDFENILTEQTVLKLRSWMRRKLLRLGASEDESVLVSSFLMKSIEVNHKSLTYSHVHESLKNFPRLIPDQYEEIAKKCIQLLLFTKAIS